MRASLRRFKDGGWPYDVGNLLYETHDTRCKRKWLNEEHNSLLGLGRNLAKRPEELRGNVNQQRPRFGPYMRSAQLWKAAPVTYEI
jgi:hypothetical protein